uniref:Uncharacterized protein n=1 Tax=Plectus sambesii TaxID=2011161 RepID=A0A914X1W3_9BILA
MVQISSRGGQQPPQQQQQQQQQQQLSTPEQPLLSSHYAQPEIYTERSNQYDYNNCEVRRPEQRRDDSQQQGNGVRPQKDASDGLVNLNDMSSFIIRIPSTTISSEARQVSNERDLLATPPMLQPETILRPNEFKTTEYIQSTSVLHPTNQQPERQQMFNRHPNGMQQQQQGYHEARVTCRT